ncbi:PLDc N-terminal domain-containing protein [Pseudomonas sp. ISL-88]|uniref:PLDc N-terminal domain-containing protein n=1 Tax=Bacteria TaxID=2 RepID=UPI001BE98884|nr:MULTISPECIES: PLDc N-terminal domain-containing protein [Bacteria]MBT2634097.1 PLDc N-terminal domain-containing protein [Bacillus sp. ISL-26]MBT2713665.1 PLDc N-terminal domain-containing protein [Pseudomonas sp. ISL-88]
MDILWELILPLLILQLILAVFALINCIKEKRTNGPKWMWAAVIILINIIGPILYFTFGRKQKEDTSC